MRLKHFLAPSYAFASQVTSGPGLWIVVSSWISPSRIYGFFNRLKLGVLNFSSVSKDCLHGRTGSLYNNWMILKCRCTLHLQMLQGNQLLDSFDIWPFQGWHLHTLKKLQLVTDVTELKDLYGFLSQKLCLRWQESTISFFEWGLHGTWLSACCDITTPCYHLSISWKLGLVWQLVVMVEDCMCRHYIKQGFLWTSHHSSRLARCGIWDVFFLRRVDVRETLLMNWEMDDLKMIIICLHIRYLPSALENISFTLKSSK